MAEEIFDIRELAELILQGVTRSNSAGDGSGTSILVRDDGTVIIYNRLIGAAPLGDQQISVETDGEVKVVNYGKDSSGNIDAFRTNANLQQQVEIIDALGARTPSILGTSDPAAATNTNLYTVPASTTTMVTFLSVCNRSGTSVNVRVGIDVGGNGTNSPTDAEWIYYDLAVAANSTSLLDAAQGLWLGALDDIVVYASASDMSFIVSGVQYA